MRSLPLSKLIETGIGERVLGDDSVRFSDIRHDSRQIVAGDLFAAMPGLNYDGASFAEDALDRGAVAVLTEQPLALEVPQVLCPNVRLALGQVARLAQGDPCAALRVVGITGTNGKTTASYLLESVLRAADKRPAVTGTVEYRGPQGRLRATHTTPMPDDLMRFARESLDAGATHLVMEVSSHALVQHRVDAVTFEVAALTNLSQDHLDYHGDMARYGAAKSRLFDALKPRVAVLNVDDELGATLAARLPQTSVRCSKRADADAEVRALAWQSNRQGIEAHVLLQARNDPEAHQVQLRSPLMGDFNLDNLLIALGCGLSLGIDADTMARGLAQSNGAPGRLQRIADPRGALIAVDYAHTPDALRRSLMALREVTTGRLWVVFGAGGDRDVKKRPLMGQAAAELAELAILTSDNPRSEPPEQILRQIEAGMSGRARRRLTRSELGSAKAGYLVCEPRAEAIELAISHARAEDTVLIAGKGHEAVQIVGTRALPFDDREQARQVVAALTGTGAPTERDAPRARKG